MISRFVVVGQSWTRVPNYRNVRKQEVRISIRYDMKRQQSAAHICNKDAVWS
jgi:hypothetical protein